MKTASLDGKVVVITGAAGLLGREFAGAVAGAGGTAVLADISPKTGALARELRARFGEAAAMPVKMDITSQKSVRAAIQTVLAARGRLDAVVNGAYPRNKNYGRKFEQVEYKDFCENVNLHLGGYFLVSQQFAEFFKKRGGGNVINISSVYGVVAPRFHVYDGTQMTMPVEYAAIKSAVLMLTRYMAAYYRGAGIRFNAISVGGIEDGQPASFLKAYRKHCLNKGMLDRSDVTGTLVYLLSEMSRSVNGQNIIVDDGFTL